MVKIKIANPKKKEEKMTQRIIWFLAAFISGMFSPFLIYTILTYFVG